MLLNPSDSVLFYSQQTREANNTVRSTISLRNNKTRRKANKTKKTIPKNRLFLVEEGGFEPPKSLTADLQSAPFGHSGTLPSYFIFAERA